MTIELIPAFSDNYFPYFETSGISVIVDPGDATPVQARLARRPPSVRHEPMILVTHYHPDHVGGCVELREKYGAHVIGPEGDQEHLLDSIVRDGDVVDIGAFHFRVLDLPGHTYNHIGYIDDKAHLAFVGDTLFAGGCGRVFSGTAEQLWESLKLLRALPDMVRVYCAHEYTLGNLEFALHIDSTHTETRDRLSVVRDQRKKVIPTIPSTIGNEKRTNIFLRADEAEMAERVGLAVGADPLAVFTELRRLKNNW
jgi:hydroxyacylglutathione hydrolase